MLPSVVPMRYQAGGTPSGPQLGPSEAPPPLEKLLSVTARTLVAGELSLGGEEKISVGSGGNTNKSCGEEEELVSGNDVWGHRSHTLEWPSGQW